MRETIKTEKMIKRIDQHLGGLLTELNNEKTFKCFNCEKLHPIKVKKDWGFDQVCPECENYLFDEAEKRDKRRTQNALFCLKYGVNA